MALDLEFVGDFRPGGGWCGAAEDAGGVARGPDDEFGGIAAVADFGGPGFVLRWVFEGDEGASNFESDWVDLALGVVRGALVFDESEEVDCAVVAELDWVLDAVAGDLVSGWDGVGLLWGVFGCVGLRFGLLCEGLFLGAGC